MNKEDFFKKARLARRVEEKTITGFDLVKIQELTAGERDEYLHRMQEVSELNKQIGSIADDDVDAILSKSKEINDAADACNAWLMAKTLLDDEGVRIFSEEESDDILDLKYSMGIGIFNDIVNGCLAVSGLGLSSEAETKKN